jgi:hypothetical protein
MEKGIKIGLYSIGGLVLASGLFFGIRAIVKYYKKDDDTLSQAERTELRKLRTKQNLTNQEQDRLNELDNIFVPGPGETVAVGSCSFPLRVGDTCKQVAQVQLAINKKHNPSGLTSGGLTGGGSNYDYACIPSYPGQHNNLVIDGQLGQSTAKQLGRWYGLCESSGFLWEVCNCKDLKISQSQYNSIISGADVSDSALSSAGYNPIEPTNSFSGYSNFNLAEFGEKYPTALGDFYKNPLDFTDDYPPKSSLERSYGNDASNSFSGESEGDYISYNDFVNEIP